VRPGPRGHSETKMSPDPDTRGRGLSHTRERGLLIPRTDHPMPGCDGRRAPGGRRRRSQKESYRRHPKDFRQPLQRHGGGVPFACFQGADVRTVNARSFRKRGLS
jgi:hypothetical protein